MIVTDLDAVDGQRRTRRPLLGALREATHDLHTVAEKTGVVQEIVRGRVDRATYALFLRNLLPAYDALEAGLTRHAATPGVRAIADNAVFRAASIARDLEHLSGGDWGRSLPLLAAGQRYADRVALAANGDGRCLIAHAYTRYLGDLNGGQVLKRRLAAAAGLAPDCLSFFEFPAIRDLNDFKAAYRDAFDRAGDELDDIGDVVDEARDAFCRNIDVSESVQTMTETRLSAV